VYDVITVKLNDLLKTQDDGSGWSLYRLQKETGISYNNLHRIASGKAKVMSFDVLEKLCDSLGCTPNDLLSIENYISGPGGQHRQFDPGKS